MKKFIKRLVKIIVIILTVLFFIHAVLQACIVGNYALSITSIVLFVACFYIQDNMKSEG